MSEEPESQNWDHDGSHLAAAKRVIRALHRGTGCHLTPEMVVSLDFAEGDGDWWQNLKESMYPTPAPQGE